VPNTPVIEPAVKRAVAFIDGQNLFHAAKKAFGYRFPNYDPLALAQRICQNKGWQFVQVRFYTGVPDTADSQFWNDFWTAKKAMMGRQGVHLYTRPLRYRDETIHLPDGTPYTYRVGKEKGIDIRIALDVIALAHQKRFDVGVIFSQDQDLSEAADEIRVIAREQSRWLKLASAYPHSPGCNRRGIDKTDWVKIDKATYDACIDPRDYRPTPAPTPTPTVP
jgi:uncharacterized LabA/DUF88 family protein